VTLIVVIIQFFSDALFLVVEVAPGIQFATNSFLPSNQLPDYPYLVHLPKGETCDLTGKLSIILFCGPLSQFSIIHCTQPLLLIFVLQFVEVSEVEGILEGMEVVRGEEMGFEESVIEETVIGVEEAEIGVEEFEIEFAVAFVGFEAEEAGLESLALFFLEE